jgi:hypothetical protein
VKESGTISTNPDSLTLTLKEAALGFFVLVTWLYGSGCGEISRRFAAGD